MATLNDFKFWLDYYPIGLQDDESRSIKLTEQFQGTIVGLSGSKTSKGIIRRVEIDKWTCGTCEIAWISGPRTGKIEKVKDYDLRDPKAYLIYLQKEVERIKNLFPEVCND